MVWGALFGRNLGVLARFLQKNTPGYFLFSVCHPEKECINPGMYALLGAMSALCGVTKMTVSSTVIMFELTGTLNYIIPTMVTLTISKWVGDVLVRGGFSDILIRFYQYPYLDPKNDEVYGISIRTAMVHRSQLCCLFAKMKLTDIEHILMSTQYHGYPVVESESDPALLGYILTGDIEKLLAEVIILCSHIERPC
jgi:chloride channel 3/4/5